MFIRPKPEIKLGQTARDTITGFEGVAIAKTEWLHGRTRLTLQPRALDRDGKIQEAQTFDEPQLEMVEAEKMQCHSDTGGPRPSPRRSNDPV